MPKITKLMLVPKKGRDVDQLRADIEDRLRKQAPTWGTSPSGSYRHKGQKSPKFPQGQWWNRASLKPPRKEGRALIFEVGPVKGTPFDDEAAGVYLGRLAEELIAHFSDSIDGLVLSA